MIPGGKEGWRCGYTGRKAPWLAAGLEGQWRQMTFTAVILHRRGERSPSAVGRAGDAFPRDTVEDVTATGVKTV